MKKYILPLLACAFVIGLSSCSHKGSSSLSSSKSRSTTSRTTPSIRESGQQVNVTDALKAEAEAEAKAKAAAEEAERARLNAEAKAKAEAEALAAKARQAEAEAAAKAKQAAEEKVVVREEKVKIVETQDNSTERGSYHIIIGAFKNLANARQLCQDAIKNGFLPSIMENEEGMYRVSIYSCSLEKTARTKIADVRRKFPEYVGTWLLVEKK